MLNFRPWLKYYLEAETIYRTHSPFLYDVYTNILRIDRYFYDFKVLENIRRSYLTSSESIVFEDYGAGSQKLNANKRMVHEIAKHGVSSEYQCRVLFNLVNYLKPQRSLELGTSLGLASMYMASARKKSIVDTVEANADLVKIASHNATKLNLSNINFHQNTFDAILKNISSNITYDFIYLDGNHTYESTIGYMQKLQHNMTNKAVVMIDDIHWSEGMYSAWNLLSRQDSVQASIETSYFGLL
nr:class I SAM-dependent methyltransferase [Saprospiraceae bacterium]